MFMIVGATGSLGGSVALALLDQGQRVRVLVRPESPLRATGRFTDPATLERAGAEVVEGDLREPDSIAPHLRGVTALLSTASGTKRAPPDSIQAVDLEGTAALARLARSAGVQHMVYVSARGAAPEAPAFLRIKWEAEEAVMRFGPPATIVRPAAYMQDWIGFVYGAQLQGGTRVQAIGSTDPLKAYVDEADVAKVVTAALLAGPPAAGAATETVELSADSVRASEVIRRMAEASGLPLTVDRVPVGRGVDTVQGPVADVITGLLTMMADQPDDPYVSEGLEARYGVKPRKVDEFIHGMFAGVPAD